MIKKTSSSRKMQKSEKFVKLYNWLQNATAWTKIKVWWRPVVLQKNAKMWENFETLQLTAECQSINKNQRFDQDQTSSYYRTMQKTEENFETDNWLQSATAWNKNQSLIKIRPVVPEKNAKKWENFETL